MNRGLFFPVFLLLSSLSLLSSCGGGGSSGDVDESTDNVPKPKPGKNSIHLTFTYGSEKEKWIEAMTNEFNRAGQEIGPGKKIFVEQIAMGSGECIEEIINNKRQTHITSPASAVFIPLGNAESQTKLGRDLVGKTQNLVLSPVVIAMWKPMAEALGWPGKTLGWKEVHDMALNAQGWASLNYPQWGQFRFGHTHPEYSNSGIISLIAETYAAAGKQRGLAIADVNASPTGQYLEEIEKAIVHYGRSTGFFGRKMFSTGPEYLSAAVLYENMVIESYEKTDLPFPVVAIYPKEGTFYSDHPIGVVDRDYVTEEHREAAEKYIAFLTDTPQQERSMEYGFRPADININLNERFSPKFGVDSSQPQTTLEVPDVAVTKAILDLWHERKKKSNIVLVLDTSGSMKEEGKMANAKNGARQLVQMLGEHDSFSFLPFSGRANLWMVKNEKIGTSREAVNQKIGTLFANGGTALYDAVIEGHSHITESNETDKINAIVVLSDGADQNSRAKLPQVISRIAADAESTTGGVRIFTIGYGRGAKADILEQIAEASKGKYFEGTPENIEKIFKEISTFF